MRDPTAAVPSLTRNEVNQRLRFQRFLLASTFSAMYLVVLAIFYALDKIDPETLFQASAIVATAILAFLTLFFPKLGTGVVMLPLTKRNRAPKLNPQPSS